MIVGGTTFMGARGDYTHTVVGALILTVLTTILVGKGYSRPTSRSSSACSSCSSWPATAATGGCEIASSPTRMVRRRAPKKEEEA